MGKQTYTNVGGTWKKNNKIYANITSTWKEVKKAYTNISGVWKQIHASGGLPAGIILPYASSAAVPTNWTEYTTANNRYIIGAGSTYKVGTSGGSTSVSVSATSSTNGSHTGSAFGATATNTSGNSTYSIRKTTYASGSHSHTVSASGSGEPSYRTLRLIKANTDVGAIPIDTCVLAHSTLTNGMSVNSSSNRYMKSSTTYNSTGGGSVSISGTTSTSGSHSHADKSAGSTYEYAAYYYKFNQGSHNHSVSLNGTPTPTYKYLSLWSSASSAIDATPNIIGMWESATAPDGWALCDGTNGTPDMRNYFLRLGNTSNHNTSGGSSTLTLSGSTSTGGSHQHKGGNDWSSTSSYAAYHSDTTAMSGHTFSWSGTYTPPYYALTFIMKLS